MRKLRAKYPLGIQVDTLPIAVSQAVEAHSATTGRRMYKAALTHINARMADFAAATGGKEHQIATLQVVATDILPAHPTQLAGGARQADTSNIPVDEAYEAAAIEAAVGRIAAIAVWRTDQANRSDQYIVSITIGGGVGYSRDRLRCRGMTGAGAEQRCKR